MTEYQALRVMQEPVLKLRDLSKLFVLQTGASGVGVKLSLVETKYAIIEKK